MICILNALCTAYLPFALMYPYNRHTKESRKVICCQFIHSVLASKEALPILIPVTWSWLRVAEPTASDHNYDEPPTFFPCHRQDLESFASYLSLPTNYFPALKQPSKSSEKHASDPPRSFSVPWWTVKLSGC
jgi:hypothetical protein